MTSRRIYPGWYFGIDEQRQDLAPGLRYRILRYCQARALAEPICVRFHDSRLYLYLGNDTSRAVYVGGCIEPNEFSAMAQILADGDTVIDAGANEGLYSVFSATRVGRTGRVFAFEPSRREFERLRANIALTRLDSVKAIPTALGERAGTAELRVAGYGHEGHNTLGQFVYDSVATERLETVAVQALDDFAREQRLDRIAAVKIDVEGAELAILRGAQCTLERDRPALLVELNPRALSAQHDTADQVVAFLRERQYAVFEFDARHGLPALIAEGLPRSDNFLAFHAAGRPTPWTAP